MTYPDRSTTGKGDKRDDNRAFLTLLAGLRLPAGEAARACAAQLDHAGLGGWEQARVVELLKNHYHTYRTGTGDTLDLSVFYNYRKSAGSVDIPHFVNHLPEDLGREDTLHLLGRTHYHLRSAHLPVLCKALFRYRSKHVREGIVGNILLICSYTDKHRKLVARTLLRYAGASIPPDSSPSGGGLDPLLVAVYKTFFLDPRSRWIEVEDKQWTPPVGEKPRKVMVPDFSRLPPMNESHTRIWDWANRWLVESTPTEADIPLIRKLVASEHYFTGMTCCRILRHIPHAVDDGLMAKIDDLDDDQGFILHLKALRGDTAARHRLTTIRQAENDEGEIDGDWPEDIFLVAFELAPEITYRNLVRLIEKWPEARALDNVFMEVNTLDLDWTPAIDQVRYRCRLPAWLGPRLYKDLHQRELPAITMLKLVQYFPDFRTTGFLRRIASHPDVRAWKGLGCGEGEGANPDGLPMEAFLASLAILDPPTLRRLLRQWVQQGPAEHRFESLFTLLVVGDPSQTKRLIPLVQSYAEHDCWGHLLFHLGRTGGSTAEAWLDRAVVDLARRNHPNTVDALCGLAAAQGLTGGLYLFGRYYQSIDRGYEPIIDEECPVLTHVIDHVRRGRPLDGLMALLDHHRRSARGPLVSGLGDVKHPRVNRYLWEVLRNREAHPQTTLGELTLQGDREAMAEYWSTCLAGRYGWIDESEERHNTLGGRLCTLPFWIEECGSNCCRMHRARDTLSHLLGVDFPATGSGWQYHTYGLVTEWVRRHGKRLRWSELLGYYIPVGEEG